MAALDTEDPVCPFDHCAPAADPEIIARGWDFEYDTTRDEFEIGRCRRCGLVFPTRLPAAAAMNTIYPPNYYAYSDSTTETGVVRLVRGRMEAAKGRVFSRLLAKEDAAVLDIGCGDGRLLEILRRNCPSGWRYSGIEISARAAERAASDGFEVRVGDFESLDVSDWEGRFDLALMHQVIEHTRFPHRTLHRTRELLRPGGILSIETPDVDAWDFAVFGDRYWGGFHIPRHFFLFGKANIAELARRNGFEVVSCKSILSPSFWIISVHNWLADHDRLRPLKRYVKVRNPLLLALATTIELVQTTLFRRSSNMQVLLKRVD